ncbi:cytochrome aa3 quinol oxidase subunit II [Paenibacillus xerothermodurans]|uniref:Quinol oxidase subunit 2 n=1 Tax=Paenibacillus xerothermodurans TaxID=1977292 RepID=A0A2W1NRH5_PAEXE|nr:cytochrome aa3 quinol oxidase subunit II [Paenibacillus xerothermodurans]PZE21483.1 cytochrome aa3 quinol oxidase subunit II [Paenibacillus xerothermodurans]
MKAKWAVLVFIFTVMAVLTGCENSLTVLDPKGPQAEATADVIMISIWTMLFVVVTVILLYVFMLVKYRASKQKKDYEPPHIEGSLKLELLWTAIPIIIVAFLSYVSVTSTYQVEATPKGYEQQKPLTIYASSSNWKWHFSYPEENIETVNYLFIPTDRPVEFKLYAHGPISSFWIPQLAGQKYAMDDMVTTLHLAADVPGEYMGRNANFTGKGFAQQTFNVTALTPEEYDKWVAEIKASAPPLTEQKFDELLKPGHLGQSAYNGTHLGFSPPPTGHQHGEAGSGHDDTGAGHSEEAHEHSSDEHAEHSDMDHSNMDHSNMDHSDMNHSNHSQ